jgi:hypothetical protein
VNRDHERSFFAALFARRFDDRSLPFARGLLNVVDCFLRLQARIARELAARLRLFIARERFHNETGGI